MMVSYFDLEENHKKNGSNNEGMDMTPNEIQSN